MKDAEFHFDESCIEAFNKLKKNLISSPILQPPDGDLPFELMCDASDYAVGAPFLAKRRRRNKSSAPAKLLPWPSFNH